jgi:voltage-gated potassium channel
MKSSRTRHRVPKGGPGKRKRKRRIGPHLLLRTVLKIQRILGPAVSAAMVILVVLFWTATALIYLAEQGRNPDFDTPWAAVRWVFLTVVQGAPWDAQTVVGKFTAYGVEILKPVSIAVLTAALTSYLFDLIVRRGSGMGRAHVKNHIVICGWSSKGAEIIREIRGRGDDESDRRLVVLAPLESTPTKDELTTFISGNPTEAADLKRAGIERAAVAIVLADNSYADIDVEEMDSRTLLTTLAIESLNPNCYTCVEVVHSINREHFNRTKADELVVSGHLTGALLAHSAVARGLSKIVDDLLTFPSGDEFYWVRIPPGLVGMKFYDVLTQLKLRLDCLPLAIGHDGTYTTNPSVDHVLGEGDRLLVVAKSEPNIDDLKSVEPPR